MYNFHLRRSSFNSPDMYDNKTSYSQQDDTRKILVCVSE